MSSEYHQAWTQLANEIIEPNSLCRSASEPQPMALLLSRLNAAANLPAPDLVSSLIADRNAHLSIHNNNPNSPIAAAIAKHAEQIHTRFDRESGTTGSVYQVYTRQKAQLNHERFAHGVLADGLFHATAVGTKLLLIGVHLHSDESKLSEWFMHCCKSLGAVDFSQLHILPRRMGMSKVDVTYQPLWQDFGPSTDVYDTFGNISSEQIQRLNSKKTHKGVCPFVMTDYPTQTLFTPLLAGVKQLQEWHRKLSHDYLRYLNPLESMIIRDGIKPGSNPQSVQEQLIDYMNRNSIPHIEKWVGFAYPSNTTF